MKVISDLIEYKTLIASNERVVIDSFASWCGPCKVIAPFFESLSKSYPDIVFAKCDIDDAEDVARELNIRSIPSFFLIRNGVIVDTIVGADKNKLAEAVQNL